VGGAPKFVKILCRLHGFEKGECEPYCLCKSTLSLVFGKHKQQIWHMVIFYIYKRTLVYARKTLYNKIEHECYEQGRQILMDKIKKKQ